MLGFVALAALEVFPDFATKAGKPPRLAKAAKSGKTSKAAKATKPSKRALRKVVFVPAQPSFGQAAGLHAMGDELALKSSVALVIDQDTNEVLFSKNPARCCRSPRSRS